MKIILTLIVLFIVLSCGGKKKVRVLPFIGNFDIEYKLVDGVEVTDTIYPKIPFFFYTDENGKQVKSADFKGKVWIADFFFTSCQTICPLMTTNLKKLNLSMHDLSADIQFISFTIDPDRDTPRMLKRYKKHHGIEAVNWTFLTGNEEKTHLLGIENFQIFAGRDEESQGGFAHSGAFTLVDKEGFVRGVYLGTDSKQVEQLEKDVRLLLKEEYGISGSSESK
ncbi:MAG: SCO family protein [Cryomorphaceae bacterium]|jgi:protein SCO1/2|nr:SCO family protein [Cryomorphaceae bacterium]